jgi:hypothetical protein
MNRTLSPFHAPLFFKGDRHVSHIVEIVTEVRDPAAIRAACQRLTLPPPVHGTTRLFSGEATGWAVRLRDWRYPVVCDTESGKVHYDNYNGAWGNESRLHRFLQIYTVEKTRIESRRQGYSMTEQMLADGSVRLTVAVGGAGS